MKNILVLIIVVSFGCTSNSIDDKYGIIGTYNVKTDPSKTILANKNTPQRIEGYLQFLKDSKETYEFKKNGKILSTLKMNDSVIPTEIDRWEVKNDSLCISYYLSSNPSAPPVEKKYFINKTDYGFILIGITEDRTLTRVEK